MRQLLSLLAVSALAAMGNSTPTETVHHANTRAAATPFWYEAIKHNGISAAIANGKNWTVFRNVKDFGAKGDGTADDTAAIQNAIFYSGESSAGGNRNTGRFGSTGQPAMVYFPAGTYLIKSTIRSAVGTVLMGNPVDRPTLKAAPTGFSGKYLLIGHGEQFRGLVAFFHGVKNLVLDSTALPGNRTTGLLEWSVSQNNLLSNVLFKMPVGGAGHTGVAMDETHSPLIMNDLEFVGGGVGVALTASTQYHLKSLTFRDVQVGVKLVRIVLTVGQGLRFENCGVGIDANSRGVGQLNLIDSTAKNTPTLVNAGPWLADSANGGLMLENIVVDSSVSSTVKQGSSTLLQGSVEPGSSWIRGNVYLANSTSPVFFPRQKTTTSRPQRLINNSTGFYYTVTPPTYPNYTTSQVINVKDIPAHPVLGDGVTDDTASLQAIINSAASASQLVYFPHGIYLLSDTLHIPPNTRIVGEAWTQISATGAKFKDAKKPTPMIQVGHPGDVGVAQMSDFVFTVADILPGAVLVEVNMAGERPGEVGFFNCHFRIGGAMGSKLSGNNTRDCASTPDRCMAARLMMHLRPTSSSYWENSWGWTADHDLDSQAGGATYPGPLGGYLVEARGGTWILGVGPEHNLLYQLSIQSATDVFIGLQQSESPYWQGVGTTPALQAPAPWTDSLSALSSTSVFEPDFSWCPAPSSTGTTAAPYCRTALYQLITNSTNISIYGAALWNFVQGFSRSPCLDLGTGAGVSPTCGQANAALYGDANSGNRKVFVYGFATMNSDVLILEGTGGGLARGRVEGVGAVKTTAVVKKADNIAAVHDGFRPAVVAGYLRLAG